MVKTNMTVLSMIAEDEEHSFTHMDIDKLIQKVLISRNNEIIIIIL